MFWVALMLVFAQVAHAFDACAAHLENTRLFAMSVSAPCLPGNSCDLCALTPAEDICGLVSELAVRAPSSDFPLAPPVILVDARFIASPVPPFSTQTRIVPLYPQRESPPLRSQYLAPQLSGRAPPFSV